MKFTSEIKNKWLEELRSGKHIQVNETLKGETKDGKVGYCCLGVLEEKVLGNKLETVLYCSYNNDYFGDEGPLNSYTKLRKLLGDYEVETLTTKNDNGHTFAEIADWIEENWKIEE